MKMMNDGEGRETEESGAVRSGSRISPRLTSAVSKLLKLFPRVVIDC